MRSSSYDRPLLALTFLIASSACSKENNITVESDEVVGGAAGSSAQSEDLVTFNIFFARPVAFDLDLGAVNMIPSSEWPDVVAFARTDEDATRGHLSSHPFDCAGNKVTSGIQVDFTSADDAATRWYFEFVGPGPDDLIPSADATQGEHGGYFNLTPGLGTLTVSFAGDATDPDDDFSYDSARVVIQPRALSTMIWRPTVRSSAASEEVMAATTCATGSDRATATACDWSCLGAVEAEAPEASTIQLTLTARDYSVNQPYAGLQVRTCLSVRDSECRSGGDPVITDADGVATIKVDVASDGFAGYLRIEDPSG